MSQIIYTIEDCLNLYDVLTGKRTILDIMYSFVDMAVDQYLFENLFENIYFVWCQPFKLPFPSSRQAGVTSAFGLSRQEFGVSKAPSLSQYWASVTSQKQTNKQFSKGLGAHIPCHTVQIIKLFGLLQSMDRRRSCLLTLQYTLSLTVHQFSKWEIGWIRNTTFKFQIIYHSLVLSICILYCPVQQINL